MQSCSVPFSVSFSVNEPEKKCSRTAQTDLNWKEKEVETVLLLLLCSNKVLIEIALVLLSDGRPVPNGCV